MRVRRTVLAPVILTIAALGSLVAAPAVASASATVAASPSAIIVHA
jgi:hypothetical protein